MKIGVFALTWPVWSKFQMEGVAPTNHSYCQKTSMNDLSFGIRMWHKFLSFYVFVGQTDRRTDGQTAFSWLYRALHYMQSHGKTSKLSIINATFKHFDRAYKTLLKLTMIICNAHGSRSVHVDFWVYKCPFPFNL